MPKRQTLIVKDDTPTQRRFIDRVKESVRHWIGPVFSGDAALHAFLSDTPPVSSGVLVSDLAALTVSAFYCGVSRISGDAAALPCFLFRARKGGGVERYETHPVNRLLHDQANPTTTAYVFRQTAVLDLLVTGNAYAEIGRDPLGRPGALWNIQSNRVSPVWEADGRFRYRVGNYGNPDSFIDPANMLHFKNMSFDGVTGLDPVAAARETLGLALAADRHAGTFFQNAGTVTGVIKEPTALSEQARTNLQRALDARHKGTVNAHRWLMLPNGVEFTPISATARDSQFNELRQHQVRDVARFLKMPPTMLGDMSESAYSSAEQEAITYVTGCLTPLLRMMEAEMNAKLIAPSERNQQHCEFVLEGLLRGDSEKRAGFYAVMASHGLMSANEIRARENLPPIDGGESPLVPLNMGPMNPARGLAATMAHRDLIVDLCRRQVTKLCDRTSRLVTPDRLQEFVMRYGDAGDVDGYAARVLPGIRAWLTTQGREQEGEGIAQTLAKAHFQDARRVLSALGKQHAGERFERALSEQIATWRTGRDVERMVDHLLAHGKPETEAAR